MTRRPAVDLSALTSEAAMPMSEASQRVAKPTLVQTVTSAVPSVAAVAPAPEAPVRRAATKTAEEPTKTANLKALAFKVSPAFRKRFRQRAADSELKLNELLFEALDAWEEKRGLKK